MLIVQIQGRRTVGKSFPATPAYPDARQVDPVFADRTIVFGGKWQHTRKPSGIFGIIAAQRKIHSFEHKGRIAPAHRRSFTGSGSIRIHHMHIVDISLHLPAISPADEEAPVFPGHLRTGKRGDGTIQIAVRRARRNQIDRPHPAPLATAFQTKLAGYHFHIIEYHIRRTHPNRQRSCGGVRRIFHRPIPQ